MRDPAVIQATVGRLSDALTRSPWWPKFATGGIPRMPTA